MSEEKSPGTITTKGKAVVDKISDLAKTGVVKSIQVMDAEQMADIVMAAAAKQDEINAVLAQRGAHFALQGIQLELSLPPTVSIGVIRLDVDQPD